MMNEFLEAVNKMIEHDPMFAATVMTDNAKMVLEALTNGKSVENKSLISDKGKLIIDYLKTLTVPMKTADIALGMGLASRSVSGAMRKLVSDGYVEKISTGASAVYIITEKGKEFKED